MTAAYSWWQLASDGSYLVLGSKSGLSLYSPDGKSLGSHAGDYSLAAVFAAPQQVRIANGPMGANLIETLSVSSDSSVAGPAFDGTFKTWFADGGKFVTTSGTIATVYLPDGTLQQSLPISSDTTVGGTGNWIYTFTGQTSQAVQVYAVGSTSPAVSITNTAPGDIFWRVIPTASTLAVLGTYTTTVIDLSGTTAVARSYRSPFSAAPSSNTYAATSSAQFVVGNFSGQIVDGQSLSGDYRLFGFGSAELLGSSKYAVLINGLNIIVPYDAATLHALPTVRPTEATAGTHAPFLSNSGAVLAEEVGSFDALSNTTSSSWDVLSLPSGAVLSSYPDADGFTLSSSGNLVGDVYTQDDALTSFYVKLEPVPGGATTLLHQNVSFDALPFSTISPDDSMVAVTFSSAGNYSTSLFKAGTLAATIQGRTAGWLDSERLLIDQYASGKYVSTAIVSPAGNVLSTPPLPEIQSFQVVTPNEIYDPATNKIYSISSGSAVWTGNSNTAGTAGVVAGPYVLHVSGIQVLAEAY